MRQQEHALERQGLSLLVACVFHDERVETIDDERNEAARGDYGAPKTGKGTLSDRLAELIL